MLTSGCGRTPTRRVDADPARYRGSRGEHPDRGNSNTWRAILHPGRVIVTPLDESTAIDLGTTVGSLVVRQVIREAGHMEGDIVTEAPWQYPAGSPPLLTL